MTTSKAPARNAARTKWVTFLESQNIDIPAGASRDDLAELWALRQDGINVADTDTTVSDADERSVNVMLGNDARPSPNPKLADQVDPEFRFSTDSGTRTEPDKLLISLDGIACYLYEPSRTLMILMASSFAPGVDPLEKVRAMLNLVNASLDAQGRVILHRMMTAGDGSFDDTLPGKLAWTILNKWAPTLAAEADLNQEPDQNRAQRRRAAKK